MQKEISMVGRQQRGGFLGAAPLLNAYVKRRKRRQRGGFLGAAPLLNAYVRRKKKQRGRGLLGVLGGAAKIGVRLGKDKRYKRMGAKGATGSYNRRPAPWEV